MSNQKSNIQNNAQKVFNAWRKDWNLFIRDVLGVTLDEEQQAIVSAVQHKKLVSVRSGTARGKDFVAACIAVCFLYLTPRWNSKGELIENTKVALTAPTDRQVKNIMMPEISRLFNKAKKRGFMLPGKLNAYDIRTNNEEWFLTGFKADEHNHEAWSGFHAVNTMFIVTEATGIADDTYSAIEGNLQGNSRLLLVFNPNTTVGYAAKSQKSDRWEKFCLNSLTAPNVVQKKMIVPGQVDYEWVKDKIDNWCSPIREEEVQVGENDFQFEGQWYRPSDLFRKKVLGEFPKVGEDVLIPLPWIELAQERWKKYHLDNHNNAIVGVDVAGMGRDASVFCYRFGNYVSEFRKHNSAGKAEHMKIVGQIISDAKSHSNYRFSIDTIGEGAGVYARAEEVAREQGIDPRDIVSCKYSQSAQDTNGNPFHDVTGQYEFVKLKHYLYWCVRDWLNPNNNTGAMLPPGGTFAEEATEVKWSFHSSGKIMIEPKEDTIARLGHSTDELDALANTFDPRVVKPRQTARKINYDYYDSILY